jgi:putative copper export protein
MNTYPWVLITHVLAATIWTGGHLILALGILPGALRDRSITAIEAFESKYERVGIAALFIQIVSGLYLATTLAPASTWFAFDNPITRLVGIKLALLAATVVFALDARLRLIPNLTVDKLVDLAWHILGITVLSVAFVVVGVGYRVGLLS